MLTELYKNAVDGYVFLESYAKGDVVGPLLKSSLSSDIIGMDCYVFINNHYKLYVVNISLGILKYDEYDITHMQGNSFDRSTWRIEVHYGMVGHSKEMLDILVPLIPKETYIKDLLRCHTTALYLRNKGLR